MAAKSGVGKSLRILMLHGYTQSGSLFDAKTKALQKHLQKAFPGTTLSYPTGPMRLRAKDVPGFDASSVADESEEIEAYGWWRRSNTADPPEYVGLEDGLQVIANTIEAEGPFDGVMGFSQGATMAAMVSSLLEGDSRRTAFEKAQSKSKLSIPFPTAFTSLKQPPLKFCVVYSGFIAPGERYTALYDPVLSTPMCHFVGSLDSVVEEDRTTLLINAAGGENNTQVVVHPGGHFVPTSRQYLDTVVAFVKAKTADDDGQAGNAEERAEDMDVPF